MIRRTIDKLKQRPRETVGVFLMTTFVLGLMWFAYGRLWGAADNHLDYGNFRIQNSN